ncbi:tyrosine-type recombinase/integrase [Novosphingobium sp. G106]|uniref:tyrosine-type recombinase/integrase n=1 Tax=Novosphingobium sp. G106 TaxID=2849500 RepID=UPI001C2D785A|nr:tyrosine-type recombinase/integrase [Novosphingobium sp. G106]MBV1692149.1 tyrosine-type recombinase/integrase [Novosphingobium sp. G106]
MPVNSPSSRSVTTMPGIAGELVMVRTAAEAPLPRRHGDRAANRVAQLTALLVGLIGQGGAIDRLAFRKSLEARAPASVKALANDLACYAAFCTRARGIGLPANEARIVAYLEDCESRKLKPATVGRRLASLAVIHGLLGVTSPTRGSIVRDALRGFRRRVGVAQRQAGPLRFGEGIGAEPAKGFTLSALLQACPGTLPGLRDAALLSLAYDTGLRVSELVRVTCDHLATQSDGSAVLTVPRSKTDQEGQGAYAWLSPDTMRRVAAWCNASAIREGPLFRRIGVVRTKAREAEPPRSLPAPPGFQWRLSVGARVGAEAKSVLASTTYIIGEEALTPAAVRLIIKRTAMRAADEHLVNLVGKELVAAIEALSTHSLRVGLTQDLFASGEDAGPIAQALRWTSTSTALRYGRKLAPASNATARMLREVRG